MRAADEWRGMARCARTGSLTHEVRCGLERVEVGRGGLSADRDPGSGGGRRSRDLEHTLRAVKCRVREVDSGGFVPEEKKEPLHESFDPLFCARLESDTTAYALPDELGPHR